MHIISPSILAADFSRLGEQIKTIDSSRAEWLHIDVMDGVFVPNISFGFPVLEVARLHFSRVLDVHLMIVNPEKYINRFIDKGAGIVTFHLEATDNPENCIEMIHKAGAKAGISIKPGTDTKLLEPLIQKLDMVLIMSVEPGFGGQKFMEQSISRVSAVREMAIKSNPELMIEVDGGISSANSALLFKAGANILVAGSSVFNAADPAREIDKMLNQTR